MIVELKYSLPSHFLEKCLARCHMYTAVVCDLQSYYSEEQMDFRGRKLFFCEDGFHTEVTYVRPVLFVKRQRPGNSEFFWPVNEIHQSLTEWLMPWCSQCPRPLPDLWGISKPEFHQLQITQSFTEGFVKSNNLMC